MKFYPLKINLFIYALVITIFGLSIKVQAFTYPTYPVPTKNCVSLDELKMIYRLTINNSAATLLGARGQANINRYDPTEEIGYCYGRGDLATVYARMLGVFPSAIKKLFNIGDMRSNPTKTDWRFHLTTMLKLCDDGKYYAIDPILFDEFSQNYMPLNSEQWVKRVRQTWDSWQVEGPIHQSKLYFISMYAMLPDIRQLFETEPGDQIINLNFGPETNPLVSQDNLMSQEVQDVVFQMSQVTEQRLFISQKNFNYKGIDIVFEANDGIKTDINYEYNGYWQDGIAAAIKDDVKPGMSFPQDMAPRSIGPMSTLPDLSEFQRQRGIKASVEGGSCSVLKPNVDKLIYGGGFGFERALKRIKK